MNEPGKSDKPIVPQKPANLDFWQFMESLEPVEGRGLAKENGEGAQGVCSLIDPAKQVDRTQSRERDGATVPQDLHSALDRVRQAACRDKGLKFTSLWHHVYEVDQLRQAYLALKSNAAAGVDGQTWQEYGKELESNLQNLSERLARGTYRAKPVRRVYIPKADGRQRPIGIPVLEDKIVQRAAVKVLNAIYETDFLGFSYGYRPGRSAHMALDALAVGIQSKKVNWLLDADIRGFFDTLDHEWLVKFVEHRIADDRVVRHIQKWLNAGVIEEGKHVEQEEGTPQGGSISPLLANLYLHYVFDLWADHRASADDCQTDACKAGGIKAIPSTLHAPARVRGGPVAGTSGAWPLPVLRRAPQLRGAGLVPASCEKTLAAGDEPARTERQDRRVSDESDRRTLASTTANLSPLSGGASGRHDPRQEPGAVVPLAGIRAGGGGQPPSLPRQSIRQ